MGSRPPTSSASTSPHRPRPRSSVCFGIVDPAKDPLGVLEAVASAGATAPMRLAFVGPATGEQRRELGEATTRLGLEGRVTVTGHVTVRDYAAWLSRADVAVQLRSEAHGEASGTVCDAIGAGVPVVTSVASSSELPEGVATVLAPGSRADLVAEALAPLVRDAGARGAMVAAERAYARSWGMEQVAQSLHRLLSQEAWRGVGGAGSDESV